jgi:Zn-dependent peptidase ImmA (M78 family)/DNA-binding XRE family transcriptional regulator
MGEKAEAGSRLGERILAARRRRGLTQEELGRPLELDKSAISRIERGERRVDSYELAVIAETLGVPAGELLGTRPRRGLLAVAARLAETSHQKDVVAAVARVRRLLELDQILGEIGIPNPRRADQPTVELPAQGNARRAGRVLAESMRVSLGLGDEPVADLSDLVERRLGIDVALEPLGEGVSGLCVRSEEVSLVLANSAPVAGHQRFTLAHELCHYLFDDPQPLLVDTQMIDSEGAAEIRANAFAAHFLMPVEGIQSYVQERALDARVITDMMYVFGVSLQALTWHLHELKMLDWAGVEEVRRAGPKALVLRSGRWDSYEAGEAQRYQVRPPTRLYQRAIEAYASGRIGVGPVAGLLQRADEEELRLELADAGLAPSFEQQTEVAELL